MNTEKIVLKDGTEIDIEGGASKNAITILVPDFETIKNVYELKLTEENLEEYKILNATGLECDTRTYQHVTSVHISRIKTGYQAVFCIEDVDMVAKQLAKLIESQEIQDEAIVELATLAVGGE